MARHNVVGRIGEDVAVTFLKSKGYKILDKNFKTKYTELDIVCKPSRLIKGKDLVFVEVRTKTGERFGTPEETINFKKKKKLMRSVKFYLTFNRGIKKYRVDVICIVLNRDLTVKRLSHYKNILF